MLLNTQIKFLSSLFFAIVCNLSTHFIKSVDMSTFLPDVDAKGSCLEKNIVKQNQKCVFIAYLVVGFCSISFGKENKNDPVIPNKYVT